MTDSDTSVEQAIEAMRAGQVVALADGDETVGRVSLTVAGAHASPRAISFLDRHARGLTCLALSPDRCDELSLQMVAPTDGFDATPPFTISVDAFDVTSTGVSSSDRAHTVKVALDPASDPAHLARPGHVFPLRAQPGGVLRRPGHTEAAVDLARLAGLTPAAVSCEVVASGRGHERGELVEFCARHDLRLITVAALVAYRRERERLVERIVVANLPTAYGEFEVVGYRSLDDDSDHVALVRGQLARMEEPPVHVHLACPIGDVFRSRACDCRAELERAMTTIGSAPQGVLLYLRASEPSRGGHDPSATLTVDPRTGDIAAQILADLGIGAMRMPAADQLQAEALRSRGLTVSVPTDEEMDHGSV